MKNLLTSYFLKLGDETGQENIKAILKFLDDRGRKAFYLDCGCGDGELTLKLAKKIGTKKIFGVEILSSKAACARQKGIEVFGGDLNKEISFPDHSFDVITAIQVIEHLYDLDTFVSELKRMLKPGGCLVISTPNLASWHNIFALLLGHQPSTGPHISKQFSIGFHPLHKEYRKVTPKQEIEEVKEHIKVLTYRSLKKFFSSYGFQIDKEALCGCYPFSGRVARFLSQTDKWHAVNIVLRLNTGQ